MDKDETTNQYIDIPEVFCSSETGKPIENCMVCGKFLLADGVPYMIEKSIRQVKDMGVTEVIFEYALCFPCMAMMQEALSVESKKNIEEYFQKHTNLEGRREVLSAQKPSPVNLWIDRCLIKDSQISKSPEYQIVAQCAGKHMILNHLPFALSMQAMDEISELMSNKTLGEIDDFMGKYFTGPPEVAEILRKRPVVLV